jgi:signal peptidase I
MSDRIIITTQEKKRSPLTAFALSMAATGLGEFYNGESARGVVLFLLRLLSIIIPIYFFLQNEIFSIKFIASIPAANLLLWIYSCVESMLLAGRKKRIILKKYNATFFYIIFIIATQALIFAFILGLFVSINIKKIPDNRMAPTLLEKEFALINLYSINNLYPGDVVLYNTADGVRIRRIIAKSGQKIKLNGSIFYVDGSPPETGIMDKKEIRSLGIMDTEKIFYEICGKVRYPVIANPDNLSGKQLKTAVFTTGENMLFVAGDNRIEADNYEVISAKAVVGKVEGVAYSSKWSRILMATSY